ncbi:MAG: DUF362 domain-containing protein [Chthoniobacterales bacterium]|nr:DUF362 domain-containing protein [Chthoniobacterales bacterium]
MSIALLLRPNKNVLRFFIGSFFVLIALSCSSYADSEATGALPKMRASMDQLASASPSPPVALDKKQASSFTVPLLRRSNVFLITDDQAISKNYAVHRDVVSTMLSRLVCAITNKKTTSAAWQSLVKTGAHGDVIGIKVTTEPGPLSGTHRELIKALIQELLAAGVVREKIIVWDRRHQDLLSAGYGLESGLQLQWIEEGSGYDPKQFFSSPLMGQLVYGDYGFNPSSIVRNGDISQYTQPQNDFPNHSYMRHTPRDFKNNFETKSLKNLIHPNCETRVQKTPHSLEEWLGHTQNQLSNESHYAWLLTQRLDKVINVPSLCDSCYCGINGALASMTLGVVDNWRRFIKAPYYGAPYIPTLYATEQIKNKVVLTIMDALALQYVGGPSASPAHAVPYGTLLASYDPVAIDAIGLNLINEERHTHQLPEVGALTSHITSAEALGLGHATKKEIEIISLSKKGVSPGIPGSRD